MDVEVGYSIGKYLSKLETLEACIYTTINTDNTGMTEEITTMIAKKLPQLKRLSICNSMYSNRNKL
jgi:hypothetical protein